MSDAKVSTPDMLIASLRAAVEHERRAWDERGREIDRLNVALSAATSRAEWAEAENARMAKELDERVVHATRLFTERDEARSRLAALAEAAEHLCESVEAARIRDGIVLRDVEAVRAAVRGAREKEGERGVPLEAGRTDHTGAAGPRR